MRNPQTAGKKRKIMKLIGIAFLTLCILTIVITAACCIWTDSAKKYQKNENLYENTITQLGDSDAYAILDMDYNYNVLLTSDLLYDEGTEQQASICCNVYYYVGNEAKMLGTVMSDGTAYPITFTMDGIYAASGHKVEKYTISEDGILYLQKGIYEQFDEKGNASYNSMINGNESESTEQQYQDMLQEYGESQIIHFTYDKNEAVNEYCK